MNFKQHIEAVWRETIRQRKDSITMLMGKGRIRQILKSLYGDEYTKRDILNFYRDHWVDTQTFEF